MPTIILSYRREDTAWIAGRIHDRLKGHYGADNVFMDIDSIPFGLDFREHIHTSLERCDILLAIVGPRWAAPVDQGQAKIFEETDWVRIEIEAALAKKIPVIPVLIDGTSLPSARDLPEGVRDIVFRQAADVNAGRDFHPHMDRLISVMDQLLAGAKRAAGLAGHRDDRVEAVKAKPSILAAVEAPAAAKPAAAEPAATTGTATAEALQAPGHKAQGGALREFLRLLTSPQGRLSRKAFWVTVIVSYIVMFALMVALESVYIPGTSNQNVPPLLLLWILVAVSSKRLHDRNLSAWWVLIPLALGFLPAPYLGLAEAWLLFGTSLVTLSVLVLFGFLKGTQGPNRFGPDPLGKSKSDATP